MRHAIYVISKVRHAAMWKQYRERGYPIISSWIDDGLETEIDFSEAWPRYLSEASQAKFAILYVEPGEVLKGGLFEAGAALGNGAIAFCVGEVEAARTLRQHPNLRKAFTLQHAFAQINELTSVQLGSKMQSECAAWVTRTYGAEYLFDLLERARRHSEESVELAQAVGLSKEEFLAIVDHVYGKAVGEISQEIAGCGTTLMTLAEAHGVSFEEVTRHELDRVNSLPIEYFQKKHAAKRAAGIAKARVTTFDTEQA